MFTFINNVKKFLQNEDGLTVVEYVIGAGLLVGVITLVFGTMGNSLSSKFSNIMDSTS